LTESVKTKTFFEKPHSRTDCWKSCWTNKSQSALFCC